MKVTKRMKIKKYIHQILPITCVLILGACSSNSVNYESCRGLGTTVWERCFWFNNAGWLGFGIAGTVYVSVWRLIYKKSLRGKKDMSNYAILWWILGTVIVLMFGSIAIANLLESTL